MGVLTAPVVPTHSIRGARFTSLATPTRGSTDTSVWMVEIDPGAPVNPHVLTRQEVFVVLAGTATVRIDGQQQIAAIGDAIVVPAGATFELSAVGSEPIRALCCLPVGGRARLLAGGDEFTPPWAL